MPERRLMTSLRHFSHHYITRGWIDVSSRRIVISLNHLGHAALKILTHETMESSIRKTLLGVADDSYVINYHLEEYDFSQLITADEWPTLLSMQSKGATTEFNLTAHKNLKWFRGHFPDHPLLPGVAQLHWACELVRLFYPRSDEFQSVTDLRFYKQITPDDQLFLTLVNNSENNRTTFTYTGLRGRCSKGVLSFYGSV
jgi:hypothetical protein